MIRVTLHTNVLASGPTRQGSAAAAIVNVWRTGGLTAVTSEHILDALRRSWAKPYFAYRIQAQALVHVVRANAHVIEQAVGVLGVASHREDDLVLATAVSGQVTYLCTGDKQHLHVRRFEGG